MRYLASIIGVVLLVPLLMMKKAFEINVRHQDIELVKFRGEKPLTLFFISDIHRRKITNRLLKKVNTEIQAVIIGGDLAERGVPLRRIEQNIKALAKIGPIYYVWGNNDREVGAHHIRRYIHNVGGIILENEAICINNSEQLVWLIGLEDVSSGRADIEKSFERVPDNVTIIFVSHTPFVFDKVRDNFHSDLLLAGHTHGGQIRLGKWGYYQKGTLLTDHDKVTLISNGFGTTLVPLRLGAPAECHILSIKHRSSTSVR
jgi:predicted MPP superfamily phosphohydrolase